MIITIGGVLAALLLYAAYGDLRSRTIPNRLNLAIALAAPLWWWATGLHLWPDIAIQIVAATIMFSLAAGAFALGMMGGGDVKMLSALALWFTPIPLIRLVVVMSLVGGGLTLLFAAEHVLRKRPGRAEIPYGVAIALAGLWIMSNEILTTLNQ